MSELNNESDNDKITIKNAFGKWFGLFLVLVSAGFIYLMVTNLNYIFDGVSYVLGVIKPVIYGCVIAYILNPLVKMYHRLFLKYYKKTGKEPTKRMAGVISGLTIFLAMITGLLIIVILCWMVIPQMITSIITLVNNVPEQANYYYDIITDKLQHNSFLASRMQDTVLDLTNYLDNMMNTELIPWLKTELLPNLNTFAMQFANGVMTFFGVLYNLFIGMIVAIYLLKGKRVFAAQAKKIAYGIFKKQHADVVIHYVRISNDMFSGFISGKIVDSTIIGLICFVVMSVMQLPYAMLVSVIVGVTNIIPVFGPYIGAVPSALLILLVSPVQAIYFIIIIVILQQLDGNIIGPAILGESTGLSAFWVLFSILLFGGFWGIAGMLVGCPLFAVIYRIIKDTIDAKLRGRSLSDETSSYMNLKHIEMSGEDTEYIKYTEDELEGKKKKKKQNSNVLLNKVKAKLSEKKVTDHEDDKLD